MITGKGSLLLRRAGRIAVDYQFGGDYDDTRTGYLLCDTTEIDPSALWGRLTLQCEDGAEVVFAVVNFSDRHLAVIGRVLPPDDLAAA
ncbi:MAG TPA: hypothetical protein VGN82_08220 [Bosea sp. (in: a-proteobacteria)]|jgi:hypothetical protein|uniref:hypothetical protein n=1 Tax=Bosea sp. (in: a-proteobacteria) TaxID=1871050 RepID=UPI002E0FA97F|nr:hypothetical protein [Bosea sp. (in: a-proteobacteria)]